MQRPDWDDYRYILAVAERGTSVAAAERLGVNHTTVLRRISAFEKAHEIKIFTRSSSGYHPTLEGEAVIGLAREIGDKLSDLRRDLLGEAVRLEGTLTVTTTDSVLDGVLARHLARFSRNNPLIHIDLTVTSARLNLTRRDADVGVRPARIAPEGLIAREVGRMAFALYANDEIASEHRDKPLNEMHWIGLGDALHGAPADEWVRENVPDSQIFMRVDTFTGVRDCIETGAGIGILPCCIGGRSSRLKRMSDPIPACSIPLWVLNHRDLEGSARVRAFVEEIADGLKSDAAILEGRD